MLQSQHAAGVTLPLQIFTPEITSRVMASVIEFVRLFRTLSDEEKRRFIPEPFPHRDLTFFQIYGLKIGRYVNSLLGTCAIVEPPPETLTAEYLDEHQYRTFDQTPQFMLFIMEPDLQPQMIIKEMLSAAFYLQIDPLIYLCASVIGFFALKLDIATFRKLFGEDLSPIRSDIEAAKLHHVNQKFYERTWLPL